MLAQLGRLALLISLAGCSVGKTSFPTDAAGLEALADESGTGLQIVRLTPATVPAAEPATRRGTTLPRTKPWRYLIGAGDLLEVTVWDHPDLNQPAGRVAGGTGLRVQPDGTFFYPYAGAVTARGRTAAEVRGDLTSKLREFIPDPQIEVRIAGFHSQSVPVTGAVRSPGRQTVNDLPLTLLEAVDAAGGLTPDADASAVQLRRNGRSYQVDMAQFLRGGQEVHNPVLQGGDVVSVPRARSREAYLLGHLVKPSALDLTQEPISLTQAVTRIGGLREDQADARGIFVFRTTGNAITAYQLDVSNPAGYVLGTRFILQPDDVVYVTSAPGYRWNRLVSDLLPTLRTVRAADLIGGE